MRSAFSSFARSRIFSHDTITPEVDHLVVVAGQHDADNVLADVMHVALDGGENDFALGLVVFV